MYFLHSNFDWDLIYIYILYIYIYIHIYSILIPIVFPWYSYGVEKYLREDEAVKELPRPEDFEERWLQQWSDGGVLSHGGTTSYYQLFVMF